MAALWSSVATAQRVSSWNPTRFLLQPASGSPIIGLQAEFCVSWLPVTVGDQTEALNRVNPPIHHPFSRLGFVAWAATSDPVSVHSPNENGSIGRSRASTAYSG